MSTCKRTTGKRAIGKRFAGAMAATGLAIVFLVSSDALGQGPGGRFSGGGPGGGFRGPGGGPPSRGSDGGSRSRSRSGNGTPGPGASDFISRMDSNGNGVLEPSEMSGSAAGFLRRIVDQIPGLDMSRPIPISRLNQEMDRLRQQREQSGGSNDRTRGSSSSGSTEAPVEALVPGFGEFMELPPVPGFGVPLDPWYDKYDDRVVRQVQDFMRRYDESKNNVLDSAEWATASWRGMDPKKVDANHDSRITGDELALTFSNNSQSGSRDRSSSRDRESSRDRNSDDSRRGRGDRGGDSGNSDDSRTQFIASMMMRRLDQNGSGSLERDEWDRLGDGAASADKNRDGRLSAEELGQFMASRSQGGGSVSPFSRSGSGGDQGGRGGFARGGDSNGGPGGPFGGRGGFARGVDSNGGPGGRGGFGQGGFGGPGEFAGPAGGGRGGPGFFGGGGPRGGGPDNGDNGDRRSRFFGGRGESEDSSGDGRGGFRSRRGSSQNEDVTETPSSYRFLSPTERLPEGLPTWWATKDRNGDGQVVMAEYAAEWSDARVSEYLQYDVNGDGVITPQEAIAAQSQGVRATPPSGSGFARSSSPSMGSRATSTSTTFAGSSSTGSSSPAPASSASLSTSEKYLKYARGVIDKYDANVDGMLSPDEWSKLSKDPSAADADGNGQITAEEYATWFSSK